MTIETHQNLAGVNRRFALLKRTLLLAVLACLLFPVGAFASGRVALVIGNEDYAQARLFNPVNDATAIADTLRTMGYRVLLVTDADRFEMESALDAYSEMAANSRQALFFYAGHAIQVEGQNYLIPTRTRIESRRDLKKLVPLGDVTAETGNATDFGVVILDACRDNPFGAALSSDLGRSRSIVGRGLSSTSVTGNTIIAYATEEGAIAADGYGKHSPYTAGLLRHLPTPNVDIRLMLGAVRDSVISATGGSQRPYVYGSLGGRRYFLGAPGTAPAQNVTQGRSLSAREIATVRNRFDEFRLAILNKDRSRIAALVKPSPTRNRFLNYAFENFKSIDAVLIDVQQSGDESAVTGRITIQRLVKENGDIGVPSEQMRHIELKSRFENNRWSLIEW